MALWDDAIKAQKENNATLTADSKSCPSCASKLIFEIKSGKLHCDFCGVSYYPEFFEFQNTISEYEIESEEDQTIYERQEIVCNACGGSIVTDNNTVATFCPFCGNNALVTNRLKDKYHPQGIIPFKITREQAEGILREWMNNQKYIPKKFLTKSVLEKVTPLYVPFWLIDANCVLSVEGKGSTITSSKVQCTYDVTRQATVNFELIPFDGSSHINDKLMESIEPYNYSELSAYSEEYLYGFFAEKYNQSTKDMSQRITNRIRGYMDEVRVQKMNVSSYDDFTIEKDKSRIESHKSYYALLPVWFLNINYNGMTYKIAINGQTGKLSGNTPINHAKVNVHQKFLNMVSWLIVIAALLGLFVLFAFILSLIFHVDIHSKFVAEIILMAVAFLMVGAPIATLLAYRRKGFAPVTFISNLINRVDTKAASLDDLPYEMPPASSYTNMSRVRFEGEDKQSNVEALNPLIFS